MFKRPNLSSEPGCRVIYLSPLKALAVDVERNLRSPLAGIVNMARQMGVGVHSPTIGVRTGDTSALERSRFKRHPAEILITTPESLYLLLTSEAGEALRTVETVIVDEIHALVPTKRGAHLALSLERLEALTGRHVQRIGLSATQRPLEEVARFLGGAEPTAVGATKRKKSAVNAEKEASAVLDEAFHATTESEEIAGNAAVRYRPVTIVDARAQKRLELRIEIPVEDMARLGTIEETRSSPAAQGPKRTSIWSAIYPRVLEIVRERQSTLIFVNARRVAERFAGALNDLAGEPIARAHHGSLAAAQRSEIEEMLKAGKIRALVCTSSLELGIDMGAVDLVVQIEAPPSVASAMQRIGRAGHQVGAASNGIIFPKYRADLVACAAVTKAMHEGLVESTRFLRNPLDVLAQQMVAIVAHPPSGVAARDKPRRQGASDDEGAGIEHERLFALVRSAAPFVTLGRNVFDGVLDMLAGRYPSDEFAELRPRVTWDRVSNVITPRAGVKRIAILNGGTIPDRGLYGVFLSGERAKPVRVGELDEEMVFESRTGDTFILGASTWRIDEITHDKVLVSPAPGEPGKMPFWHGDRAGRPLEFGRRIGALVRELREMPRAAAMSQLTREHDLDSLAAENLLRYLADQEIATAAVPDDRTIVIERIRDELGDWRVCVLTPFGSRVHAPWAMAITAKIRGAGGPDVETMWSEDGLVVRFLETDQPPNIEQLLPEPDEAANLVLRQLGSTSLFAAKFRESAARALLLPRRRANGRAPLWQQRKRAYDLLAVASRYASFPILLEAYRECLRDVFDMPALLEILRQIGDRSLRVHTVDSRTPSPFASALLFSYVANYVYDGDAPLAERRAQALSIDQDQLRELMGDADLRELLDADAIEQTEVQLQCLAENYRARNLDGVHDLLLRLGDLTRAELVKRCVSNETAECVDRLIRARRVLDLKIGGEKRLIAVEDAARYRDALGTSLPSGVPSAFLDRVPEATTDLLRRFARTHGPFTTAECAARFALPVALVEAMLQTLVQAGRVAEGGFRPNGIHREWCDVEVLRTIRRRSLARLRKEVEPVEQQTLARLFTHWQGTIAPRRGLDALLDVIETLQGAPLPASLLETEILPARIEGYKQADLDTLIAAGEVVWCGLEPLGERDGRVSLYLADKLLELWPPNAANRDESARKNLSEREAAIVEFLQRQGASFFSHLLEGTGGGYPGDTIEALWNLTWRGFVTNDGMNSLRAYCDRPLMSRPSKRAHNQPIGFRSRRTTPPTVQGRWALHPAVLAHDEAASATNWSHAIALQLLHRYGVVFRETAHAENLPGGFSAVYDVLKAMEESGKVRRGFFASDLGATQFAMPAALELLRSLRTPVNAEKTEMLVLAATDPANPYGALLRWPAVADDFTSSLTRSVGARVVLCNGALVAYLRRANPNIQLFLPAEEPMKSQTAKSVALFLADLGQRMFEQEGGRSGMLIATINGTLVGEHPLGRFLLDAGFQVGPMGFNLRRDPATLNTMAKSRHATY